VPFADDAFWPVGQNKDQQEEKVQIFFAQMKQFWS
jgi:hypothetical protein